jgi:formylglycine-generating enzyme required for sulfatase activity
MKKIFFIISLLFNAIIMQAQQITDIIFEQEGTDMVRIYYTLTGIENGTELNVSLYLSKDSGETYSGALQMLDGDINRFTYNGIPAKQILWHTLKEPNYYYLIGKEIRFKVKAEIKQTTDPETLAWQAAQTANTCQSYSQYRNNYPQGKYSAQAETQIKNLCGFTFSSFIESSSSVPFKMVAIKGGAFTMGSNEDGDEKLTHQVPVSDFYMGEKEVTQAEYKTIMGTNPSKNYGVGDNFPVYYVTWYDAIEFCNALSIKAGLQPYYTIDKTKKDPNNSNSYNWLITINKNAKGYRLPTEAEWEYAAGGGATSRTNYAGINDQNSLEQFAWYSENSGSKTHEVGTKKANSLGLYDMSGNVWEWYWDWYASDYYINRPNENPQGPESGSYRVLRGGSWNNSASNCRVAVRDNDTPTNRYYNIGFRLCRTK